MGVIIGTYTMADVSPSSASALNPTPRAYNPKLLAKQLTSASTQKLTRTQR